MCKLLVGDWIIDQAFIPKDLILSFSKEIFHLQKMFKKDDIECTTCKIRNNIATIRYTQSRVLANLLNIGVRLDVKHGHKRKQTGRLPKNFPIFLSETCIKSALSIT